jgi:hypothetical protein
MNEDTFRWMVLNGLDVLIRTQIAPRGEVDSKLHFDKLLKDAGYWQQLLETERNAPTR